MNWGATTEDWSPERRQRMREWMLIHRPWLKTTGPKTEAGKRASAYRGLKHGRRSASVHSAGAVTACIDKLARELNE